MMTGLGLLSGGGGVLVWDWDMASVTAFLSLPVTASVVTLRRATMTIKTGIKMATLQPARRPKRPMKMRFGLAGGAGGGGSQVRASGAVGVRSAELSIGLR